ncbi:MAG: carboxylyase [Betaproteobacteria bacterium RIFCSPLOWO2_02_FULL_62_17]|nr:MAG: carboxylyase [Betaproteobacteria bacterium RIFCSPLOWO2_02_FULL_62_17]
MDAKPRITGAHLDFERFRLRTFIESLPREELDRISAPIELADIAAALDGNPKAVLFDAVGREGAALAGNICASRARLALAFATKPERVTQEIMNRLRTPQDIVEVPRELAPVQAIVQEGNAADLTALPVHLQHGLDGAPYISASIDFSLDRESNWTNVGMRRLMLRGRREAGVDLNAPSDLRALYEAQVKRGAPLPVAFVVGSHPIDHLSATMRVAGDELALLASLRGATLPVVKCLTSDIRVPADAEFVLEGQLDARGFVESEGPYGEFLGYYGELKRNPVFHPTAMTRRADALFQTSTIGGRMLACTDTAQLIALRTEATLWHALQTAVREVTSVYATPQSGGAFNVRIALRQRVPGEARNAIAAAFACHGNVKNVFVVDPDIDIFSDAQMDWALATRFQADRDLVVGSGFRAMPLDPSLAGSRTWAKAGFDLTLPMLKPGERRPIAHRVPEPPRYQGGRFDGIEAALTDGPKYFEELMAATGSRDGREIVRELEQLRASRGLERDDEGRYRVK